MNLNLNKRQNLIQENILNQIDLEKAVLPPKEVEISNEGFSKRFNIFEIK